MKKKKSLVGWTCLTEEVGEYLYWLRAKEVNEELYLEHHCKLGSMATTDFNIFENKKDAKKVSKKEGGWCWEDNIKKVRITIEEIK